MNIPSFKEDHISQIPALQLLCNLGYTYISPEQTLRERKDKTSNVILEGILDKQLREINKISYKGEEFKFSNNNITSAINNVKNIPYDGLIRTNEKAYDQLTLGKSFEETIQGNTKSYDLKYIDWGALSNNVFHVTEEFEVEKRDGKTHRRPDIVLFVNGIPFAIIECKRPDIKDPVVEAISQNLRNQNEENIPDLFVYGQLLMAVSKNENKYATAGTAEKFWTVWKEPNLKEDVLEALINKPLADDKKDTLFASRFKYVRKYFDAIEKEGRLVTEQDRILYSLCRPERLLELSYQYIVYDAGEKKIARYKQYFAVKSAIDRVKHVDNTGKRKGGVIWHTQGSGKSITMVMLAKALTLDKDITNPRVVLVTDRIDLDDQIYDTFRFCSMEPVQAKTGEHLLFLLDTNKKSIITTVLDKFEAGLNKRDVKLSSENIFVLVDESHRSHYGSSNAMMRKVLPHACYIGFTGTPLMKDEKSTVSKFGGFIDKYTIDEAVDDKAVVPLLYEGRHVPQDVNKDPIDKWFERICKPLTEKQRADLKRKFSNIEKLNSSDQKIYMIAYDVSTHFKNNWKGTPFKAQLATTKKTDALKFKKFLDEIGLVTSEVVISPPDEREGYEEVDETPADEVQKFWKKMMERFSSEKSYNKEIISAFKYSDTPEILICVDKLLTGFDATKNTVLYIAKPMKEHTLLQAIARVNRLHDGKDFGFIIDYVGILGELDLALTAYKALAGYDEDDLSGTLTNVNEEIKTLPQKYSDLWDIFKEIKNKKDAEEYEQHLYDEELRDKYYEKLCAYSKTLGIAVSVPEFYDKISEEQIQKYKDDLRFFQRLRASVKQRYAEVIDYKEYEPKIQKLLDTYISSDEVIRITEQVNIFDSDKFQEEVTRVEGKAARADMIAHRTKKTIEEKFEEDPVFYEKFSVLIQQAIEDYRKKRIDDAQYYGKVVEYMESVRTRTDQETPEVLKNRDVAKAFYGVVHETISKHTDSGDKKHISAEIGMGIDDIVIKHKVVDWHLKQDIQNKILNEIEDYLLDHKELKLTYDEVDGIMEKSLNIAKRRYVE
ncbi:MAG: type I restriction endonuclease subunit R [Dehalococcoidia bacterium]|nr:MAG: type I restriction endonuclease subunit R [Dehalococcoidia bacterium]